MTLSTNICLLKDGLLQQFDPPLEVYHNPANAFVSDFVGSPNINLLEITGNNTNLDEIQLKSDSLEMMFTPVTSSITIEENQKLLLGIRPEDITIEEEGKLKGIVYSTLPSGMETIVKIDFNGTILTSVVFRGSDFKVGEEISVNFSEERYILFDAENGRNLGQGKLSPL
jgi:multiple sugar transport system ATP-binding protein